MLMFQSVCAQTILRTSQIEITFYLALHDSSKNQNAWIVLATKVIDHVDKGALSVNTAPGRVENLAWQLEINLSQVTF